MKKTLITAVLLLISLIYIGQAGTPSRSRALVHGSKQLDSVWQLKTHFVANFVGELKPLCYAGVAIWPWKKVIYFEPALGWNFATKEPIISLMYSATLPLPGATFWSWWDFEYQTETKNGYVFAQMEFQPFDWLNVGVEMEQWGNWDHGPWSIGFGPNLLLRYGVVGLDIAGHTRAYNDAVNGELVLRFHLFY